MSGLSDVTRSMRKAAPYINSTYTLIAALALFGYLGWLLDRELVTAPLFFIVGLFLGLTVGFYNFYKLLKKLDEKPE